MLVGPVTTGSKPRSTTKSIDKELPAMWWERYGVKPVRPDDAGRKKWFGAELTLKSVPHLEKTVKAASEKGAVGWWVTPWLQTDRGSQATITIYFAKQGQAKAFSSSPPPAPRARATAH